ncbi:MAG: hypothetical protein RML84_09305 [Anaerolineae bacterium]|nr:hypothetical protein [Anaerolineae bacterium]
MSNVSIRRADGGYMIDESVYVFTAGVPRVFPDVADAERYIAVAKAAMQCDVDEATFGDGVMVIVHRCVRTSAGRFPSDEELERFISLAQALVTKGNNESQGGD